MSRLLPPPPMLFLLPHVTEAFPFFLSSLAFMLTSVSSRLYLLVLSGPLLCFLSITQTAGSHPGVRVWPPEKQNTRTFLVRLGLAFGFGTVAGLKLFSLLSQRQIPQALSLGTWCAQNPLKEARVRSAAPRGSCDLRCVCRGPPGALALSRFFRLPKLQGRQKSGATQPASQTWKVRPTVMNDSQDMSVALEIKSRCSFYFRAPLTMSARLLRSAFRREPRGGEQVSRIFSCEQIFPSPAMRKLSTLFKTGFVKST